MQCSLCTKEIPKGTGIMYVYKSGRISYFCSSKCYKNAVVLKRKEPLYALKAKKLKEREKKAKKKKKVKKS